MRESSEGKREGEKGRERERAMEEGQMVKNGIDYELDMGEKNVRR